MKKITKIYEVYKFDELSEDVQEKLIEKQAQQELEDLMNWELQEYMKDEAENLLLENIGTFNNMDVYYDLSYSQGSGAMIEFTTYLEDVNKKLKVFTEKELEIFKKYGSEISVKHRGNYCYHEFSYEIDTLDLNYSIDYAFNNEEITENKFKKLDKKIEELQDKLSDLCYSMNVYLKKYGYSILEDEEYFKERAISTLSDGDYEYLEDGTIFNV